MLDLPFGRNTEDIPNVMAEAGTNARGRRARLLSFTVPLLAMALLAWGCAGETAAPGPGQALAPAGAPSPDSVQPKRGGTLRVAVVRDHSTFDPPIVLAVPDIVVTRQAYDNLILRDPDDLSLIPVLAQSWESNDDLTQFTFHLRPDVKFRHGKEFAAEDVVYTFNRLLDPDVGSPIAATLDFVTNVVALDERTVRFHLESPNTYLPDLVALYHARIIPSDIDPERLATEEFGTGPFILKEHVEDERIVMVRNPDYWWEGRPYLDEVIFFYIPEPETRAAALKSGAVDVIHDLVASNVPTLEAHPETRVSEAASAAYLNLAMDIRVPPFDNILVRRALQAATDREAILEAAQFGKGGIAYDPSHPAERPAFLGRLEGSAPALRRRPGQSVAGGSRVPGRARPDPVHEHECRDDGRDGGGIQGEGRPRWHPGQDPTGARGKLLDRCVDGQAIHHRFVGRPDP